MRVNWTLLIVLLLITLVALACQPRSAVPAGETPAPAAEAAPVAAAGAPVTARGEGACAVQEIRYFGLAGENDWSPDGQWLLFNRRDQAGIYQLFLAHPDGSEERCISCAEVPGGPSLDRHKGFAAWHPSGKYIVTQVEAESHVPLKRLTEPGRGAWNNVWLLTPDGQQWWQLTDYSGIQPTGVLSPRFSHDGKQLVWAEKYGRATSEAPFGQWQIAIADFVEDGEPHLENIRRMRPGDGVFYEAHGFTADDRQILFSADIGLPTPFALDVFAYDLATGELRNLTNSADEWDEHAAASPHGTKIALMSSRWGGAYDPAAFNVNNLDVLQTEEFLIDPDGSNWQQLTYFNTPGHPEYTEEHSVATVASWHPDGTQLAVAQFLVGESYDTREARRLWIITFQGACG
ncbi:MAG: hypothetical protein Kow0047_03230 [Anaerolineae bacterium]